MLRWDVATFVGLPNGIFDKGAAALPAAGLAKHNYVAKCPLSLEVEIGVRRLL